MQKEKAGERVLYFQDEGQKQETMAAQNSIKQEGM